MHDKFSTNPFVKLFITLLLLVIILLSKSILLLIILALLSMILIVISGISVKKYVFKFKKILLWLIFIILAYIIIFRIVNIIAFVYKIFLIVIVLEYYVMTTVFDEIDSGINFFIRPLKLLKINIDKISFDMSIAIYAIIYFIESKNGAKSILPKGIISRLVLTSTEVNTLKTSLKLKFYKVKSIEWVYQDIMFLIIFIMFFVAVLCKEVIV